MTDQKDIIRYVDNLVMCPELLEFNVKNTDQKLSKLKEVVESLKLRIESLEKRMGG